ncbi:5' nucleotidase, NT5C type [Paenibacillus mucilaginosus]|uniref:Nucleotidase n=3 Tax=Paenibacillus mucilaginosus TaxID=61624 RepID=H6NNQ3_9BACL|nr:HAD hydrolase-like protein [Paenibacillus mucilaginosus]AEI45707.1 Putative nucleotidase [Paenibacillus mucilaginosus KNP414]AFC33374.1 Putative nucleotidase [Paenibacillus mucilaginosus 3016]AFH65683.1 nucleotidase [Paenibacillus mucilaginosus K02]MCG7215104.1 HAD hydrolase-like protein [Paenibacillus mucilaginosus]WDM27097.1 HAD hydrolase-like protein [Paenibacillus mucilaginosus]
MKIGFDIDDTLINLREHAFHLYKDHLGQDVPLEVFQAIQSMGIHDAFGLTRDEGKALWGELREAIYFSACPPFPHAVEVLQELDRQGHEIYYITARAREFGERTLEWMTTNGFPVRPGRFFYGMDDTEKVHIIRDLGLDYYFDDKPAVLETLADSGVKVYAKDQPYNRGLPFPRIGCWSELRDLVV